MSVVSGVGGVESLSVCVYDGESDRHQAGGDTGRMGLGRLMDGAARQADPGHWADKMMGSDEGNWFR